MGPGCPLHLLVSSCKDPQTLFFGPPRALKGPSTDRKARNRRSHQPAAPGLPDPHSSAALSTSTPPASLQERAEESACPAPACQPHSARGPTMGLGSHGAGAGVCPNAPARLPLPPPH